MRNITQEEVIDVRSGSMPMPVNVVFEYDDERYHRVSSDNAAYHLGEDLFLAANMKGDVISVFHINNIRVPKKKPQQPQKKRKKYIRPTGTGYLEKIPFDFDKLEVGDKVQLRDGSKDVVITKYQSNIFPIGGSVNTYTKSGSYFADKGECDGDILYILKHCRTNQKVGKQNTEKSVSKKDKWQDKFVDKDWGYCV